MSTPSFFRTKDWRTPYIRKSRKRFYLVLGIMAIIASQIVGAGIEYGMAGVTIQQSSGACDYFHFDLFHQGTVWHYVYHYWEICLGSGLSIDFWPANGTNWTTY